MSAASVPRFGQIAAQLAENGYQPLPVFFGGKRPSAGEGWQQYQLQDSDLQRFGAHGTGILCGRVVGLDIDVRDPKLAAQLDALAEEIFGPAPRRIGQAPKVLRVLQSEKPFTKIATRGYKLTGDGPEDKAHRVEILAQGQQFVAFNIHPDTHEPYRWNGSGDPLTVPIGLLPTISESQARDFVAQADAILAQRGKPVGRLREADDARLHESNEVLQAADPALLRQALEAIPNEDDDYDDWIRVLYAVKGALGDDGLADFLRWSAKSSKDVPDFSIQQFLAAKPVRVGAGTIFFLATRSGWKRPASTEKARTARDTEKSTHTQSRDAGAAAPIDGAALLDDVSAFLRRFVAYPSEHAHTAHTLWIAHTHFMDVWESTPRIAFLSPEPGSGKTRALEISELLVPRPVEAINATPAYLFRKVSDPDGLPTILFDEIDTLFGAKAKEHEEIRGILNAGHRRGAKAGRCIVVGKTVKTEELPAYCAVALAGLGNLPDTILTRSVVVRMRRRAPTETVQPYRRRIHGLDGFALRDRLAAWSMKIGESLSGKYPVMPPGIEDRPADVWEPLLAVADAAGREWPERARAAAVALVAAAREHTPSLGVRLLADLRTIFGDIRNLATSQIIESLTTLDESPWADLRGQPIDARKIANLLKPYGVESRKIRYGADTVRGYRREDLHDAWTRYLPPVAPVGNGTSGTAEQPANQRAGNGEFVPDDQSDMWNTRNTSGTKTPNSGADVAHVPDVPHPGGPTGAELEL